MLKHAFKTLIPICIISFIGYLITESIYNGLHIGSGTAETVIDNVLIHSYDENSVTHGNGTDENWNISEEYSSIELEIGGMDVVLVPAESVSETKTMFSLTSAGKSSATVDTFVSGDTLYISTDSGSFISSDFFDRLMDAIETGEGWDKLFNSDTLTVTVPEKQYDSLSLDLGSGRATIKRVAANDNAFNIGSGMLVFDGGGSYTENLALDMGSGKAEVMNIGCGTYSIGVGSGNLTVNEISGSGSFHMGSGNGTLGIDGLNGDLEIEMGSGNLTIGLPENISAQLYADIGSGSVKLNACGQNTRLKDGNSLTLGSGEHEINLDISSGSIKFVDRSTIVVTPTEPSGAVTVTSTYVTETEPVDEAAIDEFLEMGASISE